MTTHPQTLEAARQFLVLSDEMCSGLGEFFMEIETTAEEIVDDVIGELYSRGGFDHFWDGIDEETKDELLKELYKIVEMRLEQCL